jgi:U6 snRNA-associated Sm-like protein LSm1
MTIANAAANFLLESTVERLHNKFEYSDVDIGVLLIRGENVVALGEIVSVTCGCARGA